MLLFNLPELELFPDPKQARQALEAAKAALSRRVRVLRWLAASLIGVAVLEGLVEFRLIGVWTRSYFFARYTILIAGALLAGRVELWLGRRRIERHLRQTLNEQGIRVCMHCGYDLRGAVTHRCAECGQVHEATPTIGGDVGGG